MPYDNPAFVCRANRVVSLWIGTANVLNANRARYRSLEPLFKRQRRYGDDIPFVLTKRTFLQALGGVADRRNFV
jgi:hypothetical protein